MPRFILNDRLPYIQAGRFARGENLIPGKFYILFLAQIYWNSQTYAKIKPTYGIRHTTQTKDKTSKHEIYHASAARYLESPNFSNHPRNLFLIKRSKRTI